MKLYRVEHLDYDYSPSLGVFDSIPKAIEYLKGRGAEYIMVPHKNYREPYWYFKALNDEELFLVYELELNVGGERQLLEIDFKPHLGT